MTWQVPKESSAICFGIKLGEGFHRKARLVGGDHVTETPAVLTYESVVSRYSVRIALTLSQLNELDLLAYDIQNDYLTAKCREKIYIISGEEFDYEAGSIMIANMAKKWIEIIGSGIQR